MPITSFRTTFGRRQAIAALGGTLAGTLAIGVRRAHGAQPTAQAPGVCVLTTRTADGPFYFDAKLVRSEIAEGKPGVPLTLAMHVLDVRGCRPIAGARVDLWHADAMGLYSGYAHQATDKNSSTVGQTFLRGTQMTDADGTVHFRTIYPGWYLGRTVHIHYKIFVDARNLLTSQLYFPEKINDAVYARRAPYRSRKGTRDVTNATDFNLILPPMAGSFCDIAPQGDGYAASLIVGVDRPLT